jgi:hypothetical protein
MAGTIADFQNIIIEPSMLVDETSSTEIYIGVSNNGKNANASTWRIKRINKIGNVWNIGFPDEDQTYTFIWNNRYSYNYM